jgi:colicin import membrane protein
MVSNRVHRAAFVRRMNENSRSGGTTRRRRRTTKVRSMRANRRAPTAAEQRAFAAGHERIFGKRKRAKAKRPAAKRRKTAKPAAAKRRARSAAPKRRKKRATPEQVAARKARKAAATARKRAAAAKKKERAAARRAKARTPEARRRAARRRAKAKWPKQTRTVRRGRKKARARVAYGPYRRARLTDYRRGGKARASYMTRGKGGRLRKIPAWAIAGALSAKDYKTSASYEAAKKRIAARRRAAAARVERAGDAFTPNAGAKRMAKKRKRKSKKGSRKAGRRKTKRTGTKRRKTSRRRKAKATAAPKRRRRKAKKATPARRRRRRAAAKKTTTRRRRRKSHAKRKTHAKRRRSVPRKVGRRKVRRLKRGLYMVANRRRRHARKHYAENRRRHSRRLHRNGRRYLRNGFTGDLMSLLKTGGLIIVGFFAHKALTGVVVNALTDTTKGTFAGMATVGSDGKPTVLAQWQKPLTGLVVGVVGIGGVSMVKAVKAETRMSIGAGIMVSFLESLVRTALTVADQPKVLSYLEGYSNSAAYSLRGARGRRGMRGLGVARNAVSTLPQFTPIGAFRQAAAGMGEFFVPRGATAGMGEYFAGPGVQGVGHYEKAGPLALQPSRSHMGQLPVDDGIRPDANLDHVMDLAESAAGLGFQQAAAGTGFRQAAAGMGEFFTASPGADGSFTDSTVPTQSQWIPNGPLWAGSTQAEAHYTESELPAGVLQGPGGNGILSG